VAAVPIASQSTIKKVPESEVECAAETTYKETGKEREFSYVIQVKHTGNVSHRTERDP
jgi:hypothetical protein